MAAPREAAIAERTQLLGPEIEQLVVESKKLGIDLNEVIESVSMHWKKLEGRRTESERGGRSKR